jgi:glycosyltransferase involved in cell wall biosynthesis
MSAAQPDLRDGLRLALLLWNGDVGGAEVVTVSLAEHMRRLGVEASLVFIGRPEPLAGRLDDAQVPYRSLGFGRGRDVLRHPRRYAAEISSAGPDGALLVECGFMGGALRAGGYGAPIVALEHGAILEVPRYPWHRRLSWRVARKGGAWADTVEVAVSDFILERVGEHPHAASVRRIYNGIDPGRFISACEPAVHADEGECVVGFAGRLIHGKGPDYLIEAIALLRSTRLLRARIAGEGPERPRLEALARSLGVEDIVEFIGLTHDICGFWSASDVAVVPSAEFTEACPMTPLEAMACGKPIVATRNGGLPEIVLDGETGLLVTPGDAEALAMALARYADDSALRSSHGSRGRARVSERFHIAGCTRSYLALFSELAARPPAVAGLSPAAC